MCKTRDHQIGSLTQPQSPDYVKTKNSQSHNKMNRYQIGRIDPDIKEKP